MIKWKNGDPVTEKEEKAIKLSIERMDFAEDTDIQNWINDDSITVNTCRNGRDVIWIITESREACVYIDDFSFLSEEEIEKELL